MDSNCDNREHPPVGWEYVELLNGNQDRHNLRNWIIIIIQCAMIIGLCLAIVISNGIYRDKLAETDAKWRELWSEYDTISYDQDGDGINVIGDKNRSYYEPTLENTEAQKP